MVFDSAFDGRATIHITSELRRKCEAGPCNCGNTFVTVQPLSDTASTTSFVLCHDGCVPIAVFQLKPDLATRPFEYKYPTYLTITKHHNHQSLVISHSK